MLVLRVSCLTQPSSQLNKIYKRKRTNYNKVVSINLTSSQRVLQLASTFRYDNFSFEHERWRFVCGLQGTHALTVSCLTFA